VTHWESDIVPHGWRRLLGEFVVIVVGVLTALGVDQWAEARQQRVMEADHITRIEADLVADRRVLADRRNRAEAGLAYLGELLAEIPSDGQIDLAPYRDRWYRYVGPAAPPMASTSAFDELISTGGLILIRSIELRTALLLQRPAWTQHRAYPARNSSSKSRPLSERTAHTWCSSDSARSSFLTMRPSDRSPKTVRSTG